MAMKHHDTSLATWPDEYRLFEHFDSLHPKYIRIEYVTESNVFDSKATPNREGKVVGLVLTQFKLKLFRTEFFLSS